ncbi:MAG: starch-binding protein, partial [Bacteroidales bacterium]|nr:starch-binding protein [Bacteroidales bacterium]
MKKLQFLYKLLLVVVGLATLSSCEDFLNDIPKGQKTPQTWADYNAFIKNTTMAYYEMEQIFNLMNDSLISQSVLNSSQLTRVHYMWDESVDRTKINADDKNAYYS